jgi:hypothetical protein
MCRTTVDGDMGRFSDRCDDHDPPVHFADDRVYASMSPTQHVDMVNNLDVGLRFSGFAGTGIEVVKRFGREPRKS